mmetsp:Transcript_3923/g.10277  ORF Transcript_3923/g.10277 Transcript_3923/m.10277 type:complete len:1079 (+) Transcript_3923:120-3356(+)
MGNVESSPRSSSANGVNLLEDSGLPSFPGSALVESALQCGSLEDDSLHDDHSNHGRRKKKTLAAKLISHAEHCVMSPQNSELGTQNSDSDGDNGIRHPDSSTSQDDANFFDEEYEELGRGRIKSVDKKKSQKIAQQKNESKSPQDTRLSSLLARSLISEVENPNTMSPRAMTQREKKLLKAQEKARQHKLKYGIGVLKTTNLSNQSDIVRPIGSPAEGVGQPSVLGSIAHALKGNFNDQLGVSEEEKSRGDPSVLPPNSLSEHRAAQVEQKRTPHSFDRPVGKHKITIGLSLSRRSASGHPDTVTRQTAFDFNELQDREYKYVSSTDSSGWKAGGGERGCDGSNFFGEDCNGTISPSAGNGFKSPGTQNELTQKVAAPDVVHIPIIHIDAESPKAVDAIIAALARGEIFIPHMAIIPEALSVNGVSPPDLVVRFGTERNEDLPPDEWPNWCLEFMHNQLYEYFHGMGARWMKRPFSITLAKKVRWKTVKHMNRYFSHAERVINAWREKGPQYLDPQLAYIEGGATPEEVARPHGIYLLRNGVPTNYFAPNFNPPYTTKMTRSLLFNVLGKSWDKKRREWSSMPIPKLITPSMLVSAMCGCGDNQSSGFVATEATLVDGPFDRSTAVPADAAIRSLTPQNKTPKLKAFDPSSPPSSQQKKKKKKKKKDKNQEMNFDSYYNVDDRQNNVGANRVTPVSVVGSSENNQIILQATTEHPSITTNKVYVENKDPLSPKLELQISSSSASFFDGVQSDSNEIPSPPGFHQSSSGIQSPSERGGKRDPDSCQQKTLQKIRQPLDPQEQRQDRQLENRPENGEINDENSGDSKNQDNNAVVLKKSLNLKNQKNQSVSSQIAADEEWLNDVGKPLPNTEYKTMASLQAEQHRHMQVQSVFQAQTSSRRSVDPLCDTFRDDAVGPGSPTVRSNNSSKSSRNAMLNKSNDIGTLSMEYSADEYTLTGCDKSVGTFDSTLLGQNFAADSKSVISAATKEPLVTKVLSEVPESTEHTARSSIIDTGSVSTLDDEPVPSDEVLFAAGWAKALDPNCGSYYYFTLDRKKTCWENPLAPTVSPANSEGSSVGEI